MGKVWDKITGASQSKPKKQYYGGSEQGYASAKQNMSQGIAAGGEQMTRATQDMRTERARAGEQNTILRNDVRDTANAARGEYGNARYGADAALGRAQNGREDILRGATAMDQDANAVAGYTGAINSDANNVSRNAGALEAMSRDLPANFRSSADAAFNATTERNQRNAMSLAAGRGAGALRTAMATSSAANNQAGLDRQALMAQENNQLLGMQAGMLQSAANTHAGAAGVRQSAAGVQGSAAGIRQGAAGVRSGVTGQELQAAGVQAGREQAASNKLMAAQGLRAGVIGQDTSVGMTATGAELAAGQDTRNQYLGSQNSMEIAQLGQNMAYEQQRQANAKSPLQQFVSFGFDAGNMRGAKGGSL